MIERGLLCETLKCKHISTISEKKKAAKDLIFAYDSFISSSSTLGIDSSHFLELRLDHFFLISKNTPGYRCA